MGEPSPGTWGTRRIQFGSGRTLLWVDPKARPQRLYAWGGTEDYGGPISPTVHELRTFTRGDKGGENFTGTWTMESRLPRDDSTSDAILFKHYSTWTTCNDVGIMLGGVVVTPDFRYFSAGLVTYNMTTGKWSNDTRQAFPEVIKDENNKNMTLSKSYAGGAAVCLPTMGTGKGGLVFFLAGTQTSADPRSRSLVYIPMTTVHFYDTLTRTFHKQSTTGPELPSLRQDACVVATQASSDGMQSSYEIFMFGGEASGYPVSSDVWILTVPGFRWFKATEADIYGNVRTEHACAVIGQGRRHMISVGGRNWHENVEALGWSDGIGVYDMTNLSWISPYKPNGTAYEKPQVVKEWYAEGNLDRVVFDTLETAKIFGLESQFRGEQTQLPIAAIVGGVLAVVLLSVVCAALFVRRRQRSTQGKQNHSELDKAPLEASDKLLESTPIHELPPGIKAHELLVANRGTGELQDREIAIEMHHDSRPQELPGSDVIRHQPSFGCTLPP
ncbi:hypothetical protein MCOR21_010296 [Pyricularia oryzae]|nr:hypothetical protein MCOR21_010296 [Pyricularia oryzae]